MSIQKNLFPPQHDTGVRLDVLPLQSSKGGRFDASRFFKGLVQLADDDDDAAAEAEADPAERYGCSDGNEPGSPRLKARARWGFARLDSGSVYRYFNLQKYFLSHCQSFLGNEV